MSAPLKTPAIFAFFLLSAGLVRADLTILQEISVQDSPKATVTTTKWKGDKLRLDIGGTLSMIIDGKNGEMVSLMHEQKLAIPVSSAVQKMAAQLGGKSEAGASDSFQLQATGRTETLADMPCEEFTGTIAGQKATVWVTKDVPEYKELSEQLAAFAPQLQQYQGPVSGDAALQGFPVLTEIIAPDGKKTTVRVQALSRKEIADADFKIPGGYRKMEIPQFPVPSSR